MFTSNELLHLVFADPKDEYYNGLLKLDLDQFLWIKLHEKYETVYFLKADRDSFSVHTLGDRTAKPYEPTQRNFNRVVNDLVFGKSEFAFGDWMVEQMKAKRQNAVAFVCSAEDFCRTVRSPRWKNTLEKLASLKGCTGALVLTFPLEAEQSKNLLLGSSVFSILGDSTVSAVRSGNQGDLFRFLLENKSGSCTILAPYTGECIRSMLLRLQLETSDHALSAPDFEKLQDYLTAYLGDLQMQITRPIFQNQEPSCYLSYHNLFLNLKDKRIWDELVQRSLAFSPEQYTEKGAQLRTALPRDRTKPIGKCIDLLYAEFRRSGTCSSKQAQLLIDLMTVKNTEENPKLLSELEGLLGRITSNDPEDEMSRSKFIQAVQFCNDWLYVPAGSNEEQSVLSLVKNLDLNIRLSQTLNQFKKQIQPIETHTPIGTKLVDYRIYELAEKIHILEQESSSLQKLLDRATLDLSLSSLSKGVIDQMNNLACEIASSLNLADEGISRGRYKYDTGNQTEGPDRSGGSSPREKDPLQAEPPQTEEGLSANDIPGRSSNKPPLNLYSISPPKQGNTVKEKAQ